MFSTVKSDRMSAGHAPAFAYYGLEILATGRFAVAGEHGDDVERGGKRARLFDVNAVVARVREARWAV